VGRWSHLAVTYDGRAVRLYVNGAETSSQPASGTIRRTTDPLWIGGNRPYGEYFRGVIDEVRVYDRALGPAEVRASMAPPIGGQGSLHAAGLVAAYRFDAGRGRSVIDASGNRITGTTQGARWTSSGRYGGGMKFDGAGEVVRVPASASLDLTNAMTVTAWIKPSERQSGWRTVVARQTDAYILMASGGREDAGTLEALDRLRFGLEVLLVAWIGFALARGHAPWGIARRHWYWGVALFVAGSVVDAAFSPADTLAGPALVAIWAGATAFQRDERAAMYALAAAFAAPTILYVADSVAPPLRHDDGGVVRAAALGLLLAVVAMSSARRRRKSGRSRSVALS
jgi:hypothetical protein